MNAIPDAILLARINRRFAEIRYFKRREFLARPLGRRKKANGRKEKP